MMILWFVLVEDDNGNWYSSIDEFTNFETAWSELIYQVKEGANQAKLRSVYSPSFQISLQN